MLTGAQPEADSASHELVTVFEQRGFGFGPTLVEMLNEHYSHRTERRGSGYTQATRYLATLINEPASAQRARILTLFPGLRRTLFPSSLLPHSRVDELPQDSPLRPLLDIAASLACEESKLLASLIVDLVFPVESSDHREQVSSWSEKLEIGSCPLAEKFFLEVAHRQVRRKGRINVLVSDSGVPLLLEKLGMGDNHSCISVAELLLNGVRLPPGCLFGVKYDEGHELRENRKLPGSVISIAACSGFRFLRLTTLAVSPENRARAFTSHFAAQVEAGLYTPGEARIETLRAVAAEQL